MPAILALEWLSDKLQFVANVSPLSNIDKLRFVGHVNAKASLMK